MADRMSDAEFRNIYGPAALVTGASSGIGQGFAEVLASRGMDLVVTARRIDRLEELAARLSRAHGVSVTPLKVDLIQSDASREILDATAGLDIGLVVSNAGFGLKGEHAANDPQAMTDMLMVNCNVPMQLAHGFIPRLRARGKGGFLMVSSTEGLIGCPYSGAYAATKALVKSLGEALWAELTPDGIDMLTMCPGATESEGAAKVGIDPATLRDVMPAAEAATLALDALRDGPTIVTGETYKAAFDGLLAMPRRDALMVMAQAMKR